MTEREFVDLLTRFENGESSSEERALIEKWLDSPNKKGSQPFQSEADRVRIRQALRQAVYRGAEIPERQDKQIQLSFLLKIAASVLLVVTLGYGVYTYFNYSVEQRYARTEIRSGGTIEKVLLSDGSIVWLKPNSSLIYPKNFKSKETRRVTLLGEALFEVEKNPAQPFVVQSGELTTTVLGTSFNIKTTSEEIEVVVLTGRVALTSATDQQGVIVLPDEKAVYSTLKKQLAKVDVPVGEPVAAAIAKDTEYNMHFEDTRMSEIIGRIEGKFNVKVTMTDPELGGCVVTADFTSQSLQKTLDIITKALVVEYDIENGTVTLRGKGCN